ncbi:MAG: hypothetical protein IJO46_15325, partial [Thermoguttaceae bacterium]|nr:hypothetical protein [Thermoguttaceae bacterium]
MNELDAAKWSAFSQEAIASSVRSVGERAFFTRRDRGRFCVERRRNVLTVWRSCVMCKWKNKGRSVASRDAQTLERKEAQGSAVFSRSRSKGLALILTGLALASFAAPGCSRGKYRSDADKEVYGLLNTVGKSSEEKYWDMENFTLAESSKSRYANRYNPDAQPSPVDDC